MIGGPWYACFIRHVNLQSVKMFYIVIVIVKLMRELFLSFFLITLLVQCLCKEDTNANTYHLAPTNPSVTYQVYSNEIGQRHTMKHLNVHKSETEFQFAHNHKCLFNSCESVSIFYCVDFDRPNVSVNIDVTKNIPRIFRFAVLPYSRFNNI